MKQHSDCWKKKRTNYKAVSALVAELRGGDGDLVATGCTVAKYFIKMLADCNV